MEGIEAGSSLCTGRPLVAAGARACTCAPSLRPLARYRPPCVTTTTTASPAAAAAMPPPARRDSNGLPHVVALLHAWSASQRPPEPHALAASLLSSAAHLHSAGGTSAAAVCSYDAPSPAAGRAGTIPSAFSSPCASYYHQCGGAGRDGGHAPDYFSAAVPGILPSQAVPGVANDAVALLKAMSLDPANKAAVGAAGGVAALMQAVAVAPPNSQVRRRWAA